MNYKPLKPKNLHLQIHSELTVRWAAELIEETLSISIENLKSKSRKAELVDARTLFVGVCISQGLKLITVCNFLNRCKASGSKLVRRFLDLIQHDQKFRKKYSKLIYKIREKMKDTIQQNGKTYVSADTLETIIRETLEGMGISDLLQEVKSLTNPKKEEPEEPKLTPEQQREKDYVEAIVFYVKNKTDDPLSGKEI